MSGRTPMERFWAKVDRSGECWNWTARVSANGYGGMSVGGRWVKAHRFAYEALVGPIPDGLQIDHLCRNRACVNPDHLEAVTQQENIARGDAGHNRRKTHCPRGHEYNEANTRYYGTRRNCRLCARTWQADYKSRRAGVVTA